MDILLFTVGMPRSIQFDCQISTRSRCFSKIEKSFVAHARFANTSIIIALPRGSFARALTRSDTCQLSEPSMRRRERASRLSLYIHATGSQTPDTSVEKSNSPISKLLVLHTVHRLRMPWSALNRPSFPDHPSRRDRSCARARPRSHIRKSRSGEAHRTYAYIKRGRDTGSWLSNTWIAR